MGQQTFNFRDGYIKKYYDVDFKFLSQYIQDFGQDLRLEVTRSLDIYLNDWHIVNISLAVHRKDRFYKILFHSEFASLPGDSSFDANTVWTYVCGGYLVTVDLDQLQNWCHKLIWEAYSVIAYKKIH
jgi:hypothetical protein